MNWIDLAIICVCLWGGVEGYFRGIRKMMLKIIILLCAIVCANIVKKHFAYYLINVLNFEHKIQEVIFNEFILPVTGSEVNLSAMMVNINEYVNKLLLPETLKKEIGQRIYMAEYGGELIYFIDILSDLIINIMAFSGAFLLWFGWLHMLEVIALERQLSRNIILEKHHRWGGAFLGMLRHFLIVCMLSGILSVLLIVWPIMSIILNYDNSLLGVLSIEVFNLLRIW